MPLDDADADDPLATPLALAAPSTPLWRNALKLGVLLAFAPLLIFLFAPLLFTAFAAWALWTLVRHPAMLRGLPRDVRFVVRLVRATKELKGRLNASSGRFTAADYWKEAVTKYADKEALIFEGTSWTYAQVDRESDRVARWALDVEGVKSGDAVALLCSNRPEHLFIWLGLAKIGAATTLINPALRGSSLRHALGQCAVRLVLFEAASAGALEQLEWVDGLVCIDPLDQLRQVGALRHARGWALPDAESARPIPPSVRAACRSTDTLLHIFTSGTTGLPKAARLNHIRFFSAIVIPFMFNLRPTDRLYCCLPMCHTAAIGGLSICWWLGMPLILARKFSASGFWKDCAESKATIVQYVGELCRYLVHSPPTPYDRAHQVRVAFGNGLRPEVWPAFVGRFGIAQVAEVYASTEGNANLANTVGKEGAVGFISPLLQRMYPVRLVKLAEEGQGGQDGGEGLLREPRPKDKGSGSGHDDGLCVLCKPGEVGELLGRVDQADASRNFAGYTDVTATRRRLVRNVLAKGDCWFRTGDLMRTDADGYVYFADRMGETFRFKGENVSTAEVAAAIGALFSPTGTGLGGAAAAGMAGGGTLIEHCLVYGVTLPHVDGKVGMAALLLASTTTPGASCTNGDDGGLTDVLGALYEAIDAQLPHYAQPRFLRLISSASAIELTETFKPKKAPLVAEGVQPSESGAVYYRDSAARTFRPLDAAARARIDEGTFVL